ncbi:hypothetical protein FisN_6Lh257 [Fistulifera solaris]|uniref:Ankyrin repeat protein n=1 Tax=Fistulifera solaris TaxID=1519565 RepID=A0A1Z5J645_FISSO|nr:hypothetical protein FisN_6Lh257 [Fistulifera solaris]|eukprot:GAX09372.1 hypothetical protein FisN_6Lh257 [Fistulifera solaris]
MSNERPELSKPLLDSRLPLDLRRTFYAVFVEAYELFNQNRTIDSVLAVVPVLHQRVTEAVTAHPVLASTIFKDFFKWSLLEVFIEKTHFFCQDTIRFLIETNPDALLWAHRADDGFGRTAPINMLAENGRSKLLLWVAERYPWVLQHRQCRTMPPHLAMVRSYTDSGICDAGTIRKFYELYPQGLREKSKLDSEPKYPLAAILEGNAEPPADLVIWMAEQYPKAIYHEWNTGYTVLHEVCYLMANKQNHARLPCMCTANMANICRFLIAEHPCLIRKQVRGRGTLPIHMLAKSCNRPLVQEMAILLMKAFPDCVNASDLRSIPFIEQVHPLIIDELEIDQEILMLTQILQSMEKAVLLMKDQSCFTSRPNSSLFNAAAETFCSWAILQVSVILPTRKRQVTDRIAGLCRLIEGEDDPNEEWEVAVHGGDDTNMRNFEGSIFEYNIREGIMPGTTDDKDDCSKDDFSDSDNEASDNSYEGEEDSEASEPQPGNANNNNSTEQVEDRSAIDYFTIADRLGFGRIE